MADDADVIVVGGGLAGLVAAPKSPMPANASSWSTRRASKASAARPSGRSADCSWSTAPNSAGSASRTVTISRCRTGWVRRASTATRISGRGAGPKPMSAFAAGEKRGWLRAMGHRIFPVVGWAERGGYDAMGHGNSVPRFHVTWGTGPGIVEPFERRAREAQAARPADVQIPPPRRCAHHHRRRRRRRQRRDPRARPGRARQEQFAQGHRRLHAARAGRDRRLRRHRRQSRSGAAELAEAPGRCRRRT